MNVTLRVIMVACVFASVTACATYTGDMLLQLPEQSSIYDQSVTISKAKDGVSDVLDSLVISEEEKASLKKISPKSIIRDSEPLKVTHVDNQLLIARMDTNIAFARNSIIISTGALHVSHSSNNIIVCGGDVEISHDGRLGNGSLIISKGKTKIGHAGNTLIYAIKGVEVSHGRNVRAFNTIERKTSWGHVNNILVKPLFKEEAVTNKSHQPTGSADR